MLTKYWYHTYHKMKEKSLVSVIIPAYNAAPYISEAIESVIAQTYPAVEIIVVDDGSTDATKDTVHAYWKEGKIIYIYQENKGLSAARNAGIRAAQGEYIALLDSDDIFLPSKIERQVAYLESHSACDICYCDIYHFYDHEPDRLLKLQYSYYSGKDVFPHLLWKNFINPLSVVFRRSVFEQCGYFNEAMRRSEDWEYWVRAAHYGAQFHFLPEILAKYRMRKGSLTNDWHSKYLEKKLVVGIFSRLKKDMSRKERIYYHIDLVIACHALKVVYAYCVSSIYPMRLFNIWIQKQRLK